jgi:hypothetical protein
MSRGTEPELAAQIEAAINGRQIFRE